MKPHEYQRAYKACYTCRKRKSRCEKGQHWEPGAPCNRCKREMRDCVFPIDRGDTQKEARPASRRLESMAATRDVQSAVNSNYIRVAPQESGPAGSSEHSLGTFSDSMMRTVISNGNDALEALFEPVGDKRTPSQAEASPRYFSISGNSASPSTTFPQFPDLANCHIHELWNACRFVKQGWFSPEEALYLVDMFFAHIQKLSPILTDYYSRHENHYQLLSTEPLLCSTILLISSRYHALPGEGGLVRSFYIHERLWTHCQHLIQRVLVGQEKLSTAKMRTTGTIEALLLLTEWHPRSLSFPPPIDGWDSDLLVHWSNEQRWRPTGTVGGNDTTGGASKGRWVQDVITPTKQSIRMSWMLTNCAMSLACELGILGDKAYRPEQPHRRNGSFMPRAVETSSAKHLPSLLYLYAEQASLQLGSQSLVPRDVRHKVSRRSNTGPSDESGELHMFIAAWTELTKLTKGMMTVLFPSDVETTQLLQRGRYADLAEYFDPMLSSWKEEYLDSPHCVLADYSRMFLLIEFYSARLSCHSLVIQAIIERASAQRQPNMRQESSLTRGVADKADYALVEEVVDCALEILTLTSELSDRDVLVYAPARVTFRAISASIFLMKGLGVGVGAAQLQKSLTVLRRAISSLRSSTVDEVQLGGRYAALLDMHLSRLENSFVSSAYPLHLANDRVFRGAEASVLDSNDSTIADNPGQDWLSLPFDTTFALTDTGDYQGFATFDDRDLDFLWNLEVPPPNDG